MEQNNSCKRGEGRRGMTERRWREEWKNIYKGPMDVDNGVKIDYGSGGWAGWKGVKGENGVKYNSINNKVF